MTEPTQYAEEPLDLTDREVQASLQSDAELLDLYVLGGQTQALLTLLGRFTPMITSVIRRVVSHAQDSEDAYQATCLILMQSARKIRSRRSIAAWLYGVAYRTACRVRAKSRRQATGLEPLELPEHAALDPIERIVRQIELSNLDRELQCLPEAYRDPLVEHYILGFSARQIAERMELSSSAVEGRLRRGRQMLRERLAERGASLSVCVAGVAWMRDHQRASHESQQFQEHFTQSSAFEAPHALSETDPYLFELVQGETKMNVVRMIKAAPFFGTLFVATTSIGLVALAMQTLDPPRGAGSTGSKDDGVQAVQAKDEPAATSSTATAAAPAANAPRRKPAAAGTGLIKSMLGANEESPTEIMQFSKPDSQTPGWLLGGHQDQQAAEKVRDDLRKPVEVDFQGISLRAALDSLTEASGISIVMDVSAMDEAGVSEDSPVTLHTQPLPLNQALALVLDQFNLKYQVHPNVIKITPEDDWQAVRYYDLSYVLPNSAAVRSLVQSALSLVEEDDSFAKVSVIGSMMVVRANEKAQLRIEKLLSEIAKLSPQNLPSNESQAKSGGVFEHDVGKTGGMGGGGMF